MEIKEYTRDCIPDVVQFERDLRTEEDFWGWEIDEAYIADVARQEAVAGTARNRSGGKRIVEGRFLIRESVPVFIFASICLQNSLRASFTVVSATKRRS